MILGILSDTHGRRQRTAVAINLLQRVGAEVFVHCGDVGGEEVFAEFAGLQTWFVWGNTDLADPTLERYAETLGLTPPRTVPVRIALGRRRIDVYHGHERRFDRLMRQLVSGEVGRFEHATEGIDYILYGHTHVASDRRSGGVRIINPGALHRVQTCTVATLDLDTDALSFWVVDEANPTAPPHAFQV